MKRLAHWLLAACCCALALAPARAQSDSSVAMRHVTVTWRTVPVLSFSASDFLTKEVRTKLQSGLPQTLTTRMYVYGERDSDPLAVAALSCRVVYDLWDAVYRVQRQTERTDRSATVKTLDAVVQQCLQARQVPLGDPATFAHERGGYVYFGVVVELNPLSQDTVQRIRRWLARPAGGELDGNAFFGSFVSIFVGRKLGSAEKTLRFRSELFAVPP